MPIKSKHHYNVVLVIIRCRVDLHHRELLWGSFHSTVLRFRHRLLSATRNRAQAGYVLPTDRGGIDIVVTCRRRRNILYNRRRVLYLTDYSLTHSTTASHSQPNPILSIVDSGVSELGGVDTAE